MIGYMKYVLMIISWIRRDILDQVVNYSLGV